MKDQTCILTQALRVLLFLGVCTLWVWAGNPNILHAQNLEWAKRAGGTQSDVGQGIAVDSAGNTYVAGEFSGTTTFGPGEANQTVLTENGNRDVFVAKYDPSGTLEWAKQAGGVSPDAAQDITVDSDGNTYIIGEFSGTATFGLGEANQTLLTAAGGMDIFVAKYDSSGALVWARRAGGGIGSIDFGFGIAADSDSNIYITGSFQKTATFGLGEANQTMLTASGADDIFVAKYETNGALVWAKRAGGTSEEAGASIAVDSASNAYVTGSFQGTATFGPGQITQTILTTASGSIDIFAAKYTSTGTLVWAKRAGGIAEDKGSSIAVDDTGNAYVTGEFQATAIFGSAGEANQTTLTASGAAFDIFVAKYGPTGALAWAKRAGGTEQDEGFGIAVDKTNNAYVTGFFRGTATFGPGDPTQTTFTSAGNLDVFVAKYTSSGALVWVRRAGGIGTDAGLGLASDDAGGTYVTGAFGQTATFGAGEANQTTLTAAGESDIFVAKLFEEPQLTTLGPAKLWLSAKASKDVGAPLDLSVQVLLNNIVIGGGQLTNISAGDLGFEGALLHTVPLSLSAPVPTSPGDTLALRVGVRASCSNPNARSASVLLWYDGQPIDIGNHRDAGSRFTATIGGTTDNYFLRSRPPFSLSRGAGSTRTSVSVSVSTSGTCPFRTFTTFGTWSLALPGPGYSGVWSRQPTQQCTGTGASLRCDIAATLFVFNPGSVTADRSTTQVFLSLDEILDASDLLVEEDHNTGPLDPGESEELRIKFRLKGQSATGQFLIGVVDATNVVPELNENNNVIVSAPIP